MSGSTYAYITDTGTIVADTSDLLAQVQGEFQTALGANLNLDASTPQGTLITAETLARTNVMQNNAEVANMMNPDLAYGTFLDALCAFLGVTRGTNQSTVAVGVTFTGNANTSIPAGSRVETSNGDIYVTVGVIAIPISLSITGTIQSQAFGAIPLPVGTLTILDGTIGWGSAVVTGSESVTLGANALLDPQLKNVRKRRLAAQGTGSSAAIMAAILDSNNVPNVTDALVVENNTGATGTVNGVTFTLPNAMWVCVDGTATSTAIAQALYDAHNGGTPWDYGSSGNGNPVGSPNGEPAIDPATGLTYNVKWTTPIYFDAYVNIVVHQANSTASPTPAVQNAIINYATGQEQNEVGLVIGANVSAFEMAGAVARQLPGLYVKSCMIAVVPHGNAAPTYPSGYSYEYVMSIFGRALLQINNITVTTV